MGHEKTGEKMLIDKLQPFWTDADKEQLSKNRERAEVLRKDWSNYELLTPEWLTVAGELTELGKEASALKEAVEGRYIDSFKKRPIKILDDVREIVNATDREEFISHLEKNRIEIYRNYAGIGESIYSLANEEWQQLLAESTKESYSNMYYFLGGRLQSQLKALDYYGIDRAEYDKVLHVYISQWYKREKSEHPITVPHGKLTDSLAKMGNSNPDKDLLGNAYYNTGDMQAVVERFDELRRGLNINAHKLLTVATGEFAKVNNYDMEERQGNPLRLGVHFSFTDYAEDRGIDLTNKEQVKELRKSINKDLTLLRRTAFLRWDEKVQGKPYNFDEMGLFGRTYLKDDVIYMEFTQSFGLYLSLLPLTQYSKALLLVDGRNPNAYNMGLKMCEHFNLDNNRYKGTHNVLRVSTLLKETSLPSYDKVTKQRTSWESKIKEPFEQALDKLYELGVISSWSYAKTGGIDLTDEEGYNITNFHEWQDLLIKFELSNPKDQTERLERKAKERKRTEAKKARASNKRK